MKYSIPSFNYEKLEKKLKTISNKCRSNGCYFKFVKIGEEFRPVEFHSKDGKKSITNIKFIDIDVEGEVIKNGYELVAIINHEHGGNVINVLNDFYKVPSEYYSAPATCEHCGVNRYRNVTFLVYDTNNDEFKQIGKACLKLYTNGISAEDAAAFASAFDLCETYSDLSDDYADFENIGSSNKYIKTLDLLNYYIDCTNKIGYSKSENFNDSTKVIGLDLYKYFLGNVYDMSNSISHIEHIIKKYNIKENANISLAKDMIAWAKDLSDYSDFNMNLKTICGLDYITDKYAGFLAYLPTAYNKAMQKEKEKQELTSASSNVFVGNVGDTFDGDVTVTAIRSMPNYYGYNSYTNIYTFSDSDGHTLVWKTDKNIGDVDDKLHITGKVKEHKEYNGIKQTILTRCKVSN